MHSAAFTTMSGLSMALVLLPLPWHWRAKNTGTLINIFWLFFGNLNYFVNSISWWDNYSESNPIWCDISTKVSQAVGPGIVCSTLCITRRLAAIASARSTVRNQAQNRRTLIIDLHIGLGIPIILCACTIVSQGHRFDIYEGVGCYAAAYIALPYIFLYMVWPVVITTVSAAYGCRAAMLFLKQRLQFKTILKSSQSGLDTSRFLRLMALAFSDLLLTLPLSISLLVLIARRLVPWVSWAHVHEDFSRVGLFTADAMFVSAGIEASFELPRWLCCLGSCFFFLYFGVTDDALAEYGRWTMALLRLCRLGTKRQFDTSRTFIPQLGSFMEAVVDDSKSVRSHRSARLPEEFTKHTNPRAIAVSVRIDREMV